MIRPDPGSMIVSVGRRRPSGWGRVYLRQCLTQQTFTRVAVVDGVPVGIIMGKNERTHRCPWSLRWRAARAVLALLATGRGGRWPALFRGGKDQPGAAVPVPPILPRPGGCFSPWTSPAGAWDWANVCFRR